MYAFRRDLEARGLADRVLTLVWSELGRRPQENASGGTDHGAADCGFVIGTQAAGKMIDEWPGLAKGLNAEGNVKGTSDFRGLYCSLLEQWLGQEVGPVIPGAARRISTGARWTVSLVRRRREWNALPPHQIAARAPNRHQSRSAST